MAERGRLVTCMHSCDTKLSPGVQHHALAVKGCREVQAWARLELGGPHKQGGDDATSGPRELHNKPPA